MDAFLFPGQGSQFVGMGRDWHARSAGARAVFANADQVTGWALTQLCFSGPAEVLDSTDNTQPALLVASVAALRALEETSATRPAYVAGHSLGEFSALVAAGALSFEDALRLVVERARLMQQAGASHPGGMAAVLGLSRAELEAICAQAAAASGEHVGIANDNCPGQLVISGARSALQLAMDRAREQGAKRVLPLAVSIAAHSPLMADAATSFQRALAAAPLGVPSVPFVSSTTATPVVQLMELREVLGRQLTAPVRWHEAVLWMIGRGVTRFIEVGPKDVLTGLVRRISRDVEACHVDAMLAGAPAA